MIEYKTRRRASDPRRGEKVWIEGKIPANPLAHGSSGFIAVLDYTERECVVILEGRQETFSFEDLKNCWCDGLNSYIVEEPYVDPDVRLNGADS